MKKTMKFRIAVIVALILSVAGLLMLTGCDSGAKDVDIYISKADMP